MPNSYDHCATLPQIAHEIAHGGRDGGEVVFSLAYDAQRSPYRARGLALYAVAVEFSWLAGAVGLIGIDGRPIVLTYANTCQLLPAVLWASSPVQVSLVIEEAQHIPPPATPARRAALEARLDVVQTQITPAAAAAIRGEWESRPASARRAGYLAAAAFMDAAILFDVERGAV